MSWVYTAKLNTSAGFAWRWWGKTTGVYCITATAVIFVDSKTFTTSLLLPQAPCPRCFCGRRERVWNFICLSKGYDVQEGQSFQDMFNGISSLAFNTEFIKISTWVYIFLPDCRAKNVLLCKYSILCVNFFNCNFMCEFFSNETISSVSMSTSVVLCVFLICFQLPESVNHPSDWTLA